MRSTVALSSHLQTILAYFTAAAYLGWNGALLTRLLHDVTKLRRQGQERGGVLQETC